MHFFVLFFPNKRIDLRTLILLIFKHLLFLRSRKSAIFAHLDSWITLLTSIKICVYYYQGLE